MSNADSSGLGKLMPGFEFLQTLARQAAGGLSQTVGQVAPQLPNLGHWIAPTYDVKELEKRIEELRAVHFWLDQNTRTVATTIQALEVQKMTLNTLQNMNVSLSDVAESLKIKSPLSVWPGMVTPDSHKVEPVTPPSSVPRAFAGLEIPPRTGMPPTAPVAMPTAAPVSSVESSPQPPAVADGSAAAGAVDPMQWWGALTQQFQTLASSALKEVKAQSVLDPSHNPVAAMARDALKSASDLGADMALKVAEAAASVSKAPLQAEVAAPVASASSPAAATKPKTKPPVKPAIKAPAKPLAKAAAKAPVKAVKKPAAKAPTKR